VPQIICNRVDLPLPLQPAMPTVSTLFDFERNIFKRPEFAEVLLGRLSEKFLQTRSDKLLQSVARVVVDVVTLAEVLHAYGDVDHADCPVNK
jgi:hypothetical protein